MYVRKLLEINKKTKKLMGKTNNFNVVWLVWFIVLCMADNYLVLIKEQSHWSSTESNWPWL